LNPLKIATAKRIDVDPKSSDRKGLLGLYEQGFRRFKTLGTMIVLVPMYFLGAFIFSLALFPSVNLYVWCSPWVHSHSTVRQAFEISMLIAGGYILFGFSLILVVPIFNFLLRAYPKPWRGPYYSLQTIRWGVHNALTYIPRYIFLEYMTPTPFNLLFYRLMGMKMGKNVQLNTTNISDPCLIELEDNVTIGGSATMIAHYAQGGFLVIAHIKVGRGATIGLRATIMGDVEIGEKAKILPNSVVLPKTRIPAGETWGGVPAQKIEMSSLRKINAKN
jgi:hypothetical protein